MPRRRADTSSFSGLPPLQYHRSSAPDLLSAPRVSLPSHIDASHHQDIQRPPALDSPGYRYYSRPLPHRAYHPVSSIALLEKDERRHSNTPVTLDSTIPPKGQNTAAGTTNKASISRKDCKSEDSIEQPKARDLGRPVMKPATSRLEEKNQAEPKNQAVGLFSCSSYTSKGTRHCLGASFCVWRCLTCEDGTACCSFWPCAWTICDGGPRSAAGTYCTICGCPEDDEGCSCCSGTWECCH